MVNLVLVHSLPDIGGYDPDDVNDGGNPENGKTGENGKIEERQDTTSPAFIKASVYLLVAWLFPHSLKPENLMREWAAQGKLFSFHVEKAQNQANKHLLIFSQ